MTGRTLSRWVFSWLCRWFPARVPGRRRPVVRSFKPMLTILEERWSPTSLNGMSGVELAPPPHNTQINSAMAATAGETRKSDEWAKITPSENIVLLSKSRPADEDSLLVRTPIDPPAEQARDSSLDALFPRLSSQSFSPLSTPPKQLAMPQANNANGGGAGIGGRSTPNAGMGGGGPTGGGGGPGVVNANQFVGVDFGAIGNVATSSSTPTSAPAIGTSAATATPANGQAATSPLPAFQSTYSMTPPTQAGLSYVPSSLSPFDGPDDGHDNQGHHNGDPLNVLDLNTGETIPANVTLNTFSNWGENLLAQVSNATVSSYSWNVSQAPDLTNVSGTTTAQLQGTWANFTGSARTDIISVTETAQNNSQLTMTMTFAVAGTNSPAYSSTRPSNTWPTVIAPDQLLSGQATQAAGPYASMGLADGSVQTSFAMPSYNPNTTPVSLDYNSTTANAQPIFLTEYQLPFGQSVPSTITARLTFNGTALATVSYNTSSLNPGDYMQIGLQANATNLNTGRYPYSISVTNGSTQTTYSGDVDIVNQKNSPYGAGWALDNVEQLVPVSGGIILVDPGGTSLWFASNGSGYTTPAGDFSTLTFSNNVYTRTMPDGTKLYFNSSGQETSSVDRDGNTTTFAYSSGLLTTITDMNNQVTTLTYTSGKLTSIEDPALRTATLAYTGNQLTSITDPAGDLWQYTYDGNNNLTKLNDPNTHATSLVYNSAGRVSSVTQPDSTTLQLTAMQMNGWAAAGSSNVTPMLLAAGDTAKFTDGNNNVWSTGLDWFGYGQDVADIDPLGDASLNYINTNGLAWMSSDALSRRTRQFFDNNGNPTEIVNPDDSYAQYQYNSFSEPTQYTNEINSVTTYVYNSKGDLTQETNALNQTTTEAYNSAGLVTSMTDANNHTWTYTYDSLNRKTGETDPMSYTQSWVYDSASNLTKYTDQNGNNSTYAYDAMGRMTSETLPDTSGVTSTYTFTYDKVGNQTSEVTPITSTQSATTTDTYDAMNRLSTETDPLNHVTTYVYDHNGNQTGVINPLGNETTYTYNAANEQTGETIPLSGSGQNQVTATTTYGYDAAGEQTSVTDAVGDLWQYSYNNRGWAASTITPTGDETTYGYDAVGDQTSETEILHVGSNYTYETTYTAYNAIGEKTAVTYPDGGLSSGTITADLTGSIEGSYSGALGGGLSGTFCGTISGSLLNSSDQVISSITGSLSGTLSGHLLQNGAISAAYSGIGYLSFSGGVSSISEFNFGGQSWLGTNSGGAGSIGGSIDLSLSGSVGSGSASGSIGGLMTVNLSGGGSCSSTPYGTYSGSSLQTCTYAYDAVGNLTSDSCGGGCSCGGSGSMTYGYNADNRQTSMTEADGSQYTYAYDGVGNQTQVTNPLGYATNDTYDGQGRLLTETNALSGQTSYAYNLAGWQTSETDPDNNITQYGYNAAGELTSETNPLNYQEAFSYDSAGEVTAQTDYNGQQTQYSYNEAGWETGETWLNSQNQVIYQASYTYDNAGRLTLEQDGNSKYSYTYNGSGELTKTVVTYPGVSSSPLVTLNYGYDTVGNRTSLSDNLGGSTAYSYDAEHKLTSESFSPNGGEGPQVSFSYDSLLRPTGTVFWDCNGDNFITGTYTLDPTGKVTNMLYTNQTKSTTLGNYTYGYDAADWVTNYQDANSNLTYGYDKTGQLTSSSGTLNGSNNNASWSYDANGNRNSTGYQIGTGNELLNDGTYTYTYDKNGNTLTKTNTATGDKWTYSWDYHNQMTEAVEKTSGGVQENDEKYTYDVEGRLISANVNGTQQRWTVFDGANAYMDFNGSGTSVTERYLTNPTPYGTPYARIAANGSASWYVTDWLGSVRQIVDASGNVLDTIVYDAWGNIVNESNAGNGDRFKYDGGQYDSIQQTYLFNARWDNPQDGRWESPDPLGLEPGTNPFRFVNNVPTNAADPNGMQPHWDRPNPGEPEEDFCVRLQARIKDTARELISRMIDIIRDTEYLQGGGATPGGTTLRGHQQQIRDLQNRLIQDLITWRIHCEGPRGARYPQTAPKLPPTIWRLQNMPVPQPIARERDEPPPDRETAIRRLQIMGRFLDKWEAISKQKVVTENPIRNDTFLEWVIPSIICGGPSLIPIIARQFGPPTSKPAPQPQPVQPVRPVRPPQPVGVPVGP